VSRFKRFFIIPRFLKTLRTFSKFLPSVVYIRDVEYYKTKNTDDFAACRRDNDDDDDALNIISV